MLFAHPGGATQKAVWHKWVWGLPWWFSGWNSAFQCRRCWLNGSLLVGELRFYHVVCPDKKIKGLEFGKQSGKVMLIGKSISKHQLKLWNQKISVKESACNAGDTGDAGLIPGLGRSPGRGNGNPLQYSRLETLSYMDRRGWWATGYGATESGVTDHMCTPRKYMWWREGTKPLTTDHDFSVWLTHQNPHSGWEYGTQPTFSQLTV